MGKNKGKKKNKGPESGGGGSSGPSSSQQQQQQQPPPAAPLQPQRQQQPQQQKEVERRDESKGGKKMGSEDLAGGDARRQDQQQQKRVPQQAQQLPQTTEDFPQLSQQPSEGSRGKRGKKTQREREQGGGDTRQEQPPQQTSQVPQQSQQVGPPPQQAWHQPQQRQQSGPPPQQTRGQTQQHPQEGPPPQQRQQSGPPLQQTRGQTQQRPYEGPPPQQARSQPQQRQQTGPPPQQARGQTQQHPQEGPPPQQRQQTGPPPQQARGQTQQRPQEGPPPQQAWGQPQQRQQIGPPPQQAWGQPQRQPRVETPPQQYPQKTEARPQEEQKGRGRGAPIPSGGRGRPPPGSQTSQPVFQEQSSSPRGARGSQQQQPQPVQEQTPRGVQRPRDVPQGPPVGRTQQPVESPQRVAPPPSKGQGDTSASVEYITSGMSSMMKGKGSIMPTRNARPPKEGRGLKTTLETNHLELKINYKAVVYHYDVTVTPDKPYKFYRPALEQMRQKFYPSLYPAFDGKKNLFSSCKLPIKNEALVGTVDIWDEGRAQSKEIEVKIKFAAAVRFSTLEDYLHNGSSTDIPQETIQALDIVLRNPAVSSQRFVQVGRSYFSPPREQLLQLGGGLDLWYGFFQSAIIGWKPYLNIDVAHKGFPAPNPCLDHLCEFLRVPRGQLDRSKKPDSRGVDDFRSFIRNLRIVYEIPKGGRQKRTYKVSDLTECPREHRFTAGDRRLTVEEYFKSEYNYVIQYPFVPCLKCGSNEKPIALPLELCRVMEGQAVNRKLNDLQTRNMVRAAATAPADRRRKIEGSMRAIPFNDDPCMREFGIKVATQFTEVEARILNPPNLLYRNDSVTRVQKGVWKSGRFIRSNPLKAWSILNTDRFVRMEKLQELAVSLQKNGSQLGMDIAPPTIEITDNPRDVTRYLQEWKRAGFELAIVILPGRGNITYARVKQMAEQQVGILTQCLKAETILKRLNDATVINILLKINSKHNGINHNITCKVWLKYFQKPIIVFGADVTHPAPGQTNVPSVAAVSASFEPRAFQYNMEWRFQPAREEMILDLENIVVIQLQFFYKSTGGLKPEKIFFYRDGVSEGQFKKVLDIELQAIRRACKRLGKDYEPPITFLVVQKRHHTRFFPSRPEVCDGRNRNVPAGTVVDTTITHRNEVDFYLVSHASIQGTSRPTKYHLLWDDSNISEDDLEEITYYLCHLFTRCTRAVSYPAPTYYAHLAAFRIRSYYDEKQGLNLTDLAREQERKKVNADLLTKSPMFFV